MDGKVPETMPLRNKKAPKMLNSGAPEASNHLVRTERRAHVEIVPSSIGPDSPPNARNIFDIQHFYCVFQFASFGLTTYLPTDRGKPGDSGFCAPESLSLY